MRTPSSLSIQEMRCISVSLKVNPVNNYCQRKYIFVTFPPCVASLFDSPELLVVEKTWGQNLVPGDSVTNIGSATI